MGLGRAVPGLKQVKDSYFSAAVGEQILPVGRRAKLNGASGAGPGWKSRMAEFEGGASGVGTANSHFQQRNYGITSYPFRWAGAGNKRKPKTHAFGVSQVLVGPSALAE